MNTHFLSRSKRLQREPCVYPESKKILLIDDDKWIRMFFNFYAKEENCCLLILETAEQGLEKLNEQEFDMVVVDHDLPGMNGLEFLTRIQESHPNTVKILVVNPRSDSLVSFARLLGIQTVIEKSDLEVPFNLLN